jgi:hypothetical protein
VIADESLSVLVMLLLLLVILDPGFGDLYDTYELNFDI